MPDDPEGIYSRDLSQSRAAPPAHLDLACIVHISMKAMQKELFVFHLGGIIPKRMLLILQML